MKSRAAVALAAGQPLRIVEIDVAPPTMPLSGINDAFDLMHAGKSIRGVVRY